MEKGDLYGKKEYEIDGYQVVAEDLASALFEEVGYRECLLYRLISDGYENNEEEEAYQKEQLAESLEREPTDEEVSDAIQDSISFLFDEQVYEIKKCKNDKEVMDLGIIGGYTINAVECQVSSCGEMVEHVTECPECGEVICSDCLGMTNDYEETGCGCELSTVQIMSLSMEGI